MDEDLGPPFGLYIFHIFRFFQVQDLPTDRAADLSGRDPVPDVGRSGVRAVFKSIDRSLIKHLGSFPGPGFVHLVHRLFTEEMA